MKKTALWTAALAVALGSYAAAAQDCPEGMKPVVVLDPSAPSTASPNSAGDPSGPGAAQTPGRPRTVCQPIETGVGGAGNSEAAAQNPASSYDSSTMPPSATPMEPPPATPPPAYIPPAPTAVYAQPVRRPEADMRGLTVLGGAGVEAYAGALAPRIRPGAAWGVTAAIKPTRILGIEFGYTGAANDIAPSGLGGLGGAHGPDLIRNGGQAALTLGFTTFPIQPYGLAGVGVDAYSIRTANAVGYKNDVSGAVPIGGGIRGHFGHFTADARGAYDFTFDQNFANGTVATTNVGRYSATLNLGATF